MAMDHPKPASSEFLKKLGPYPNRRPGMGGPSVKHVVLFQMVKDKPLEVEQFFAVHFRRVLDSMPGVESYRYGPYSSFENFNKGFDWGVDIVFEDQYARDFYIAHEEHENLIEILNPLLENGFDSVVAFDMLL